MPKKRRAQVCWATIFLIIYLNIIIYIIILYIIKKIRKFKNKSQGAFQNISDFLACFSTNFV